MHATYYDLNAGWKAYSDFRIMMSDTIRLLAHKFYFNPVFMKLKFLYGLISE